MVVAVEPVAVVGRGCVLPGALTPEVLWRNIRDGVSSLSPATPEDWVVPPRRPPLGAVGGFVRGFDAVFDPAGFRVDPGSLDGLDPLFRWVLHAGREALRECGGAERFLPRAGLVLGNLSLPPPEAVRWVMRVWSGKGVGGRAVDPRNRFFSGLPAHVAAEALGLGLGGFALDAACASSLYAVKLACDRLADRSADLVLAGGANHADPLFLHRGFGELSALSPTGRSRPFQRGADGLVPAGGAGVVALMRLADARSAGIAVLAVIRGVGLANDGAAGGLLGPSALGQERAVRRAYEAAGVDPATVSLLECHATGTPVGDVVEVRWAARVFAGCADLPIGSVKSNLGHGLAAAGMAGLLKVIGAQRAGVRPATLHVEEPVAELRGTVLRPVREAEEWPGSRRAAVSGFGFGGANAHLVVDPGDDVVGHLVVAPPPVRDPGDSPEVAVVSLAVRIGADGDTEAFRRLLVEGAGARSGEPRERVDLDPRGLRFPPVDLRAALGQHVLLLDAAVEAAGGCELPRERTAVVVGMGGDAEVARHSVAWRLADDREEVEVSGPLTAARVTGTMPNLVANRVNVQLDLGGPGLTVSAEEGSGLVALEVAARALRAGECDAALVGAVDLSHETAHLTAVAALGDPGPPADAAVALVLKRVADARRDRDEVLAVLGGDAPDLTVGDLVRPGTPHADPAALIGRPHAAVGLLAVATAVTALRHRVLPGGGGPAALCPRLRVAEIGVRVLGAPPLRVRLTAGPVGRWSAAGAPRLLVFSGRDRGEVLAAARGGARSAAGPARLAVVVRGDDREAVLRRACDWLDGRGVRPAGAAYRDRPVGGGTAFVYTNGAAAYPGMGRELVLALPELVEGVGQRCGTGLTPLVRGGRASAVDRLVAASWLALLHTELSTRLLGLRPAAALGYSSGESTALMALRAWPDVEGLLRELRTDPLFAEDVAGEHRAVRAHWARHGHAGGRWTSHLVHAPVDLVRAAVAEEPWVHLMTVNAPDVCVVGGEEQACRAWLAGFGAASVIPVDYDVAAHAPELAEVRRRWWAFHHRRTDPVDGVRFYSCATGEEYVPTAEGIAEVLTWSATSTVDFAATVERAYADGVRVFVEHGPRGWCTGWIGRTLGERDHVAVCLDAAEGSGLDRLCSSVADLVAAGVAVDAEALFAALGRAAPAPRRSTAVVSLPAHPHRVGAGSTRGRPARPPLAAPSRTAQR
ncbi:beta-ketoacyl synthase N-terminal-like domain-containing protein [Saccharothrix xinjiangensis]|uniref:Beta-ketoacyl synthase N-terminal-like domain-containing protein n=2 Tax=Saccharothrix xinjiangensis TaxID=204798 RepID=A0ABV9XZU3_9PSEU